MRNRPFCRLIFSVFVAIFSGNPAVAQLAYSPFTEGSVAYIALTGPEINFARGNPAALAARRSHTRFVYSMENNHNNFDSPFRGFGLQVAVNSYLTLGIGRWERTATTGAVASRFFSKDPLRWVGFGYRQDWSAGLGLRLNRLFTFGASMRKEQYTASPTFARALEIAADYWTADFGANFSSRWLNLGMVWRNAYQDHDVAPAALIGTGQLTAGRGERDDRIFNDSLVRYGALGAQFRSDHFSAAVTWIIPIRALKSRMIENQYGIFEQWQATNHQLLAGLALGF